MPLLAVNHLTIAYDGHPAIEDVSCEAKAGEVLAIVGESGSGKSTLLHAMIGLLPQQANISGSLCFDGQEMADAPQGAWDSLRGSRIGMVFQDAGAAFCPIRTVGEQMYEAANRQKGWSRGEFRERTASLLARVHLTERVLEQYPFRLSGGMAQRIGIVSAMLLEPQLLLADEPTSALDTVAQASVVQELLAMRDAYGTAIVLVTHHMGVARTMADRVLVLKHGHVMEYGKKEIFTAPKQPYTRQLLDAVPRLRRQEAAQ